MFYLQNIALTQFKNHTQKRIEFTPKLNAICGNNGVGKTNILDAIHYLCLTKSYFHTMDSQSVLEGNDYYTVEGSFVSKNTSDTLFCGYQRGGKKIIKRNDIPFIKLNEHVGNFPILFNAPNDSNIITEGSDERRRLIDATLSQTNADYLTQLLLYNRLIAQRNAQLKLFEKENSYDEGLLQTYDEQIAPLNFYLHTERKKFIESISSLFLKNYYSIASQQEPVSIQYQSRFHTVSYADSVKENRPRDRALGYSTVGIHRDDIELQYNAQPAKKWASQGQQKTLLLALRFAQLQFMEKEIGRKPILLLDDIFDKLDTNRSDALIHLLQSDLVGQVIITHTSTNGLEGVPKIKVE